MIASEFLQVYPREMTEWQIHHGVDIPEVRDAQQNSYGYGMVAHAALRGEWEQIVDLLPPLVEYTRKTNFNHIEATLLETPGGWDHRNEVSFSQLNEHMGDLWRPLVMGGWPKKMDRERTISLAMNSLAMEGLTSYLVREHYVKTHGSEGLYDPKSDFFINRFNGAMQEIDVAIVIMGIIRRHPNLTVVPAPIQFESSNSGANADLLVIDVKERRLVGVQTKTTVRHSTVEKYDSSRIALIDGTIDLGNVRVVRTKKGRSTTEPKPWPGIVAASTVHSIPMYGKNQQVPAHFAPLVMRYKMRAREAVGNLRVDHRDLSATINDRILNKL
jgi:hypothetical protein